MCKLHHRTKLKVHVDEPRNVHGDKPSPITIFNAFQSEPAGQDNTTQQSQAYQLQILCHQTQPHAIHRQFIIRDPLTIEQLTLQLNLSRHGSSPKIPLDGIEGSPTAVDQTNCHVFQKINNA